MSLWQMTPANMILAPSLASALVPAPSEVIKRKLLEDAKWRNAAGCTDCGQGSTNSLNGERNDIAEHKGDGVGFAVEPAILRASHVVRQIVSCVLGLDYSCKS